MIGFFAGGNVALGWMIGSALGGAYDYSQIPDTIGPRLQDRTVQLSSYGAQIPIIYGAVRLAGNVIWPANFDVKENSTSESAKGGPENVTFTYSASFALLLCEGPIAHIGRMWMNKKLVYDPNSNEARNSAITGMTIYLGTETQMPDPLMVATDGSAPAYRGWAYIVFEDLELTNSGFGNRIPSVEVEVFTSVAQGALPAPRIVELGASASIPSHEQGLALVDPETGFIWSTRPSFSESTIQVRVTNDDAKKLVGVFTSVLPLPIATDTISWPYQVSTGTRVTAICFVPSLSQIWIATEFSYFKPFPDSIYKTADQIFVFQSKPPLDLGAGVGLVDNGNVFINNMVWNPITNVVMVFRGVGVTLLRAPLDSLNNPRARAMTTPYDFLLAHGLTGTVTTEQVVLTPLYFCVFFTASPPAFSVSIYRLADYGLHATLILTTGNPTNFRAFYDPDRDRLIHSGTYKNFDVIDIAALTVTPHSFTIPSGADTSPIPGASIVSGIYAGGKYIFGAWGLSNVSEGSTLYTVDPVTLVCEFAYTYESTTSTYRLYHPLLVPKDPDKKYLIAFMESTVKRLYYVGAKNPVGVPLSTVVSDLSTRVPFGLAPADVNTISLTDTVDGYMVGQQMTRRQAIEPLMAAYFFDGVESDHQMKFVKRGAASAVTIPIDDRAAHVEGEEMPPHLSIERVSELELPWTIDVSYIERARDYEVGTQYERRITRNANDPRRLEMAITMTAAKAKQVAMVNLYLPWLRSRFSFSTTYSYAKYEPSDPVTLPTESAIYTARITGRSDQVNGIIRWEAELEDGAIYTQLGTVPVSTWVPQTLIDLGSSDLELLDMPILRDGDDNAGFYVAIGGYTAGWPGAQLFKSGDGGSSYAAMLTAINTATIGSALSVLGNFTAGNIFDNGNSVTVVITSGGPLLSATDTQVLNGSNTAVIGAHGRWEVINYKNATLIATDTYLLSGFLRGRRGTEWATGTHVDADKFILADATKWQRPNPGSGEIGISRKYKAATLGQLLSSVADEDFTNTGVGLEPYAPVDLLGARDASGNLTISWHRRSRIGHGGLHTIVPLGEAVESYSTDIMQGAVVKRTIASTTPTALYTASQQVMDFGSAQGAVAVNVYQISASVARGYALNGTI